MFALYKKELQAFFFSPFAYVLTALFMLIIHRRYQQQHTEILLPGVLL